MDKQLIAQRFAKARGTYTQAARAQRQVAEKMLCLVRDALPDAQQEQLRLMEIGCGTGIYSELLLECLHPQHLLLVDLCPEMESLISELTARYPEVETTFKSADAEQLAMPEGMQLITSCSTMQWFESPAAFVERCASALVPQGILAFSTFGPDNLCEIKSLTGHGLTYPSLSAWHQMIPPTLHLLHAEEEHITLWFPSPVEVLRHLKETGVTGTEKRVWSKQRLNGFCRAYTERFCNAQGEVSLTYHPFYLIFKNE